MMFSRFQNALVVFPCFVATAFLCSFSNLHAQDATADAKQLERELKVVSKFEEAARKKWEDDIQKLEALDQTEQHPDDAILFIGSSSVRLWKTIEDDMAPYHPIRRGYGGARYSDLAVFTNRLVSPHEFRAVVMFVANDVSGGDNDNSTDEVEQLVRNIMRTIRKTNATAPLFIVEVTPTMKRYKAWKEIRAVNVVLRDICLTSPNAYFVATAEHYLDAQKKPITDLFVEDQLHLNETGYDLWGKLIKGRLGDVLGAEASKTGGH